MLTNFQLAELYDKFGTPDEGRKLIGRMRIEAPVRAVASRSSNVVTYMVSRKMGREIATESRHVEFPAAVDMEFDPKVLEYYPQPHELKLELVDPTTGEVHHIRHTPDFLTIGDDGFTLHEWKTMGRLQRLAEKYPYRYECDEDGRWFSSQIERQLAELGIRYRIHSDQELPRQRIENYLLLADYFSPAAEPCPQDELERLKACLQEEGAIYLQDLYRDPLNFQADHVLKAIADGLLVVDMDGEPLTQVQRARVFRDVTYREFVKAQRRVNALPGIDRMTYEIAVGSVCNYDGRDLTITLIGESKVLCSDSDGHTISFERKWFYDAAEEGEVTVRSANPDDPTKGMAELTEKQMQIALDRLSALSGQCPAKSARSARRWMQRKLLAAANGLSEVVALAPRTPDRGNRTCKLREAQLGLIERVIAEYWLTNKAASYSACHQQLKTLCHAEGLKVPALPTLIDHIKRQATNTDLRVRHGKRMAYQKSEFVDVLYYNSPVHGSRPFQYVHIDHTLVDIELRSSRTGKRLGRPWLTLVIDAWSRRILAFYLSFDPPSYVAVMMAIRDLVRRHHRLPEVLIVDNGADLRSIAFRNFMRAMGVHLRYRPAGQPRAGAVMERIVGTMNTEYVHNLAGNTKATKNVRMVSGRHLPANLAEWTLELLYYGVEFWAMEFYNHEPHPALDRSPMEAWQDGLRDSGSRAMRRVELNRYFLIASCPPVGREGTRKVHGQTGIKVDNRYYWHAEFARHGVAGTSVEVRYDPWDASSVYARVNDEWVHARCRALVDLQQLTECEREALTEEYGRRGGNVEDIESDKQRLREFMKVFKPAGALELLLERQAENKALCNQLGHSSIEPAGNWDKFPHIYIHKPDRTGREAIPATPQPIKTSMDVRAIELPDFDSF